MPIRLRHISISKCTGWHREKPGGREGRLTPTHCCAREADMLEGGCNCGFVRYRMTSGPIFVNGCHCRMCQRTSGSAFAINAMIEADRVELIGEGVPEIAHPP